MFDSETYDENSEMCQNCPSKLLCSGAMSEEEFRQKILLDGVRLLEKYGDHMELIKYDEVYQLQAIAKAVTELLDSSVAPVWVRIPGPQMAMVSEAINDAFKLVVVAAYLIGATGPHISLSQTGDSVLDAEIERLERLLGMPRNNE